LCSAWARCLTPSSSDDLPWPAAARRAACSANGRRGAAVHTGRRCALQSPHAVHSRGWVVAVPLLLA
jgi:hypothetical protein